MFPRHTSHTSTSTALALATSVALLATGCTAGGGDAPDDAAGSPSGTSAPDATPEPTEQPSPADLAPSPTEQSTQPPADPVAVEAPSLDEQCVIEPGTPGIDRIVYAVPSGWKVEGRCDILDPELEELPEDTEVDAAVIVSVTETAFSRASEPSPATEDVTRFLGARAGLQAYRETAITSGEGLEQQGIPVTSWKVDLDPGTDENGGTLTMSTGTDDAATYALAGTTLDLIAQTLVIDRAEGTTADTGTVVTRTEGGGTPYTVTHDGDCFALRPGGPSTAASDELCDLDPTSGEIVTGVLGDDVLVGHAPPTTVALALAAGDPPFGLATSIEGSSLFAFRVDGAASELTALAAGGAPIATVRTP